MLFRKQIFIEKFNFGAFISVPHLHHFLFGVYSCKIERSIEVISTVVTYWHHQLSLMQHSPVLEVDHFSIAPSEFYLPPGGQMEFTVVFTPPAVGNYSRQFHMSCDNGQMLTFTLQGEFVC